MKTRTVVFTIIAITCLASTAFAAPQKFNFQGKLTNSAGNPVTGTVAMTFTIYDAASGGNPLWTEPQNVPVSNGAYNVMLGKENPIDTELPSAIPLWLGVKVGSDAEMSPLIEITPGPYTTILMNQITVKDGNIGIGTTTPTAKLEVIGDVCIGGNCGNNTGYHHDLRFGPDNGGDGFQIDYDAGKLYLGTLDSPAADMHMIIQDDGNVGIGTTTPGSRLEVVGDVCIGGNCGGRSEQHELLFFPDYEEGGDPSLGGDGFQFDYYQERMYLGPLDGSRWHMTISDNGNVGIGVIDPDYTLDVAGTLKVSGADLAEPFDMIDIHSLEMGDVVVIDPQNSMHVTKSTTAYDTMVAGIVSSTTQAGYVAGSRSDGSSDKPIALVGRVLCNVSGENGAIKIGDLLTTANMPGYAMKATDAEKRQGAVLGKALQTFDGEQGQILVLVTLQ